MESKGEKFEKKLEKKSEIFTPQQLGEAVAKNLAKESKILNPSDLQKKLEQAIFKENPDYTKAIFTLMELRDRKQNIYWRTDTSQQDKTGRELIIRDARDVKYNPKFEDKYAYQIQAINNIRGALLLLGDQKKEKHKKLYDSLLKHFIENVEPKNLSLKETIKHFKKFNTVLLQTLSSQLELPIEEVKEQLGVAREFANLEIEAKDVVTVNKLKDSNGKDVIAIQGEIALTELTPELEEKYKNRKEESWYQKLSESRQKLVDKVADHILEGNRTIPTQLRKVLIGARNAFVNVTGVIDKEGKFIDANDNPHSGTIAYYGKDSKVNQEIANLHAGQLKNLHNINHLITLNSPTNPMGDDKKIVEESSQAMKSVNGLYSNLPLNWIRRFTPNIYNGVYDLLGEASKNLLTPLFEKINTKNLKGYENLKKDIQDYLDPKVTDFRTSEQELTNNIETKLTDLKKDFSGDKNTLKLIDLINLSVKISYLTRNNFNITDEKNQNLFIAALTNILDSQLNSLSEEKKHARTSSACQSGKDRDGLLIFTTDLLNFFHFINGLYQISGNDEKSAKNNQENLIKLAEGGHTQFMAGFLGGTLGAFGIKSDSIGAIPVGLFPEEVAQILVLATAQLNKEILMDEKLPLNEQFLYTSDVNDFDSQMAVLLNALNLQITSQENKISPKNAKQFFSGLFTIKDTTKFQKTQLDELKKELVDIMDDLEKHPSKTKQLTLNDVVQHVSDTLNFLQDHVSESLVSDPGTTIQLLKVMQTHLKEIQKAQSLESNLDTPTMH